MPPRPRFVSAFLILATIAAGLAVRLIHVGLPFALVKYGGSALWAAMIYWIVTALRPRCTLARAALASAAIAAATETFKLVSTPGLDAFRLTLAGRLLLGRVFAIEDFLAYGLGIAGALALDRSIRGR